MTLGWNRVGDDLPPFGLLQPSGRVTFSKVGKNQDKGRRLCKAGRLPVAPDWLRRTLAARISITCLRRLLLTVRLVLSYNGSMYGVLCERERKMALEECVQWESVPSSGYVGL